LLLLLPLQLLLFCSALPLPSQLSLRRLAGRRRRRRKGGRKRGRKDRKPGLRLLLGVRRPISIPLLGKMVQKLPTLLLLLL